MKIAILTPGGVDRSGTHRVIPHLLWLIERLARAHDVHVFALAQEARPGHWTLSGAQVHNAGRRPRALRMLAMIAAEHRRGRFDIVHAFWASPCGAVGAAAARWLGLPMVLTLPGGDLSALPEIGYGARRTLRGRTLVRLATSTASEITAASVQMCAEAAALGLDVACVPHGVALDRWPPSPPRRRDPAAPIRLIGVGSLNRIKDQTTQIEAAALLRDRGAAFTLDLVGIDTLGGEMQALASRLGLGAELRFHGFVPHHDLRPLVEAADILVHTALHETGPLVLLEAALAGLPCIGTPTGQIADFAPEAALAIPFGDPAALAGSVLRLADDEDLRLALAQRAQLRAAAIDADFGARRFEEIYRDAVNSRPAPRH